LALADTKPFRRADVRQALVPIDRFRAVNAPSPGSSTEEPTQGGDIPEDAPDPASPVPPRPPDET